MRKWMIGAALVVGAAGCGNAPQATTQSAQTEPAAKTAVKAVAQTAAKPKSNTAELAVCPTMQHPVPRDPKNGLKYAGMTVYFCCPACRTKFEGMKPEVQKSRIQSAQKIAAKQSA